jgi:hypothetical protein
MAVSTTPPTPDVVVFFGEGLSRAAPAGLPLFPEFRRALAKHLGLDPEAAAWQGLAPEDLLSRLFDAGIDTDAVLRAVFGEGRPNALHHVIANVLAAGGAAWTTNYDECVEGVAERRGMTIHAITLDEKDIECRCGLAHLCKPHGTVGGRTLVSRVEQVLEPLAEPWRHRLLEDVTDRELILIGYAGADVDLRNALEAAVTKARAATWLVLEGHGDEFERRFADLVASRRLSIIEAKRPDQAFFAWAEARGFDQDISQTLRQELAGELPHPQLELPPLVVDRFTFAGFMDSLGDYREARRMYRGSVWRSGHRGKALRNVVKTGLIHGAWWRPLARVGLRAWTALPRLPGQSLAYTYLLLLLEHAASHGDVLPIGQRALERVEATPELALRTANAAKLHGDFDLAVALARDAQEIATKARDLATAAWATNTLCFTLRWQGDLDAASREARRLLEGRESLARPLWVAWGHFHLGASASLSSPPDWASAEVGLAAEQFEALREIRSVIDAYSTLAPMHRLRGETRAAEEAIARAREHLVRWPQLEEYREEVLACEEGELARARGDLTKARALYAQVARSRSLFQRVLALLGLGEIQLRVGEHPSASREALQVSEQLGLEFGIRHALVTLVVGDVIDEDEAVRQIGASTHPAPTRDDGTVGIACYAVGPDPGLHLIALP